jgi:hypothetical protein
MLPSAQDNFHNTHAMPPPSPCHWPSPFLGEGVAEDRLIFTLNFTTICKTENTSIEPMNITPTENLFHR